jgi:hypothetical protein
MLPKELDTGDPRKAAPLNLARGIERGAPASRFGD